jgi:thymidylate synthase
MNKLDKDYKELLQDILTNGVTKMDRTGTGTISVFGHQIRHRMSDGFPVITTKKMYWKGIVTELIWFLRGETNIKYLVDNDCHIWDGDAWKNFCNKHYGNVYITKEDFIERIKDDKEFAKKWGDLGPIYGHQWRKWNGIDEMWNNFDENGDKFVRASVKHIDQIQNLINDLKTNPDSRRLMVNAWNVGELDQMVLPPCHYGFQVWTRELSLEERKRIFEDRGYVCDMLPFNGNWEGEYDGFGIPRRAISLMWNQRSVDTGLGWPYNVTSYGLLLTILGKLVNMIPDELICNLGDCHIYSNHIEGVKEQLTREPYQLPTLKINSGNENWHLLELDEVLNTLDPSVTFKLENYQSHPTIKLPLSN